MKYIFTVIAFITTIAFASGQAESASYKSIVDSFEINYNADDIDGIFSGFAVNMQNALPIDKTRALLTGLKTQAGKMVKREFTRYNQSFAVYKVNFEKAIAIINISIDGQSKINGFSVEPFKEANLPTPERNETELILPFKDEWTVVWGGDTKEMNYHIESKAQKNAFDLVVTNEKGSSFKTTGSKNEDYYAFGKELLAPCDGDISLVVDGVKDNIPGVLNPMHALGNTVVIKTLKGEYIYLVHFKQYSIVVKQGQKIKQGQLLGLCGNSGNSSEPHLHFHIQNTEEMSTATGIKSYFNKIKVNGQLKTNYSPVQKEKIGN